MAPKVPWETLFAAAAAARRHAHAPYSKFKVGAAVWAGGKVYAGCNVENSSYPVSLCAERNAIGQAVAAGARRIDAVAIVAATPVPCPPCGMCRQAIIELARPGTPVRARTPSGKQSRWTIARLLPDAFTQRFL
jgi:cytidine deaminase